MKFIIRLFSKIEQDFMRRILLAILLSFCLLTPALNAQQDAQYTMHFFNRQVLNPAYAGAMNGINLTLLGRTQWVGFPGQPQTMTASASAPIKALHGGLGGYVIADQLGPWGTAGARLAYAFHLNAGNVKINLGVDGGFYQKSINAEWIYNDDVAPDPTLGIPSGGTYSANTIVPDMGAGLYIHMPFDDPTGTYPHDKFYVSANVSHLLEPSMDGLLPNGVNATLDLNRSITGSAGYTFEFPNNRNIKIQPNVYALYNFASLQLAGNANLYISPMVFGLSYRGFGNTSAASALVGFNATKNLFIAYSYDYILSELGGFTTGSHELVISYTIITSGKLKPWETGTKWDQNWR